MNRQNYFNFIESKFSELLSSVEHRSSLNLNDSNIHAEDFFLRILNVLFDYELENINVKNNNVASIDLLDKKNKVCFQITSTFTKKKIQNTLNKFDVKKFPGFHLKFLFITSKRPAIKSDNLCIPEGVELDSDNDLYNITQLLSEIKNSSTEKIKRIYEYIRIEFEKDPNITSVINSDNVFYNSNFLGGNIQSCDNSCHFQSNKINIIVSNCVEPTEKKSIPKESDDVIIRNYLNKARLSYSLVKNLLNSSHPCLLEDVFVCNNLKIGSKIIENFSIEKSNSLSCHLIIKGIAGSGKSMFIKHLFLNAASDLSLNRKIPILIQNVNLYHGEKLKDYILNKLGEFSDDFSCELLEKLFTENKILLLVDALDEIKVEYLSFFLTELNILLKKHPTLSIVLTSRPIGDFFELTPFVSCEICCFTLSQSIEFIRKQKYDNVIKLEFEKALKKTYYKNMQNFASNPLLLSIMLLTYSDNGKYTSKSADFYSKVYKTLSKQHNKSVITEKKLYTNISYNEFAELFSKFCAITFKDGVFEFDEFILKDYIKKVIGHTQNKELTFDNFLSDVTLNMCLMFKSGDKYFFIHRSFQEYFTAVYFSSFNEIKLKKLEEFFVFQKEYIWKNVLDMLYEIIPNKVEAYIFLPYLSTFFHNDKHFDKNLYWKWLQSVYSSFIYIAHKKEYMLNSSANLIYAKIFSIIQLNCHKYKKIISKNNISFNPFLKECIQGIPKNKVTIALKNHEPGTGCDDELLNRELQSFIEISPSSIVDEIFFKDLDSIYDFCRLINSNGFSLQLSYHELINKSAVYEKLCRSMEKDEFPLMIEYKAVHLYFDEIRRRVTNAKNWDFFDDYS